MKRIKLKILKRHKIEMTKNKITFIAPMNNSYTKKLERSFIREENTKKN
jgi:hypothetical protein